MGRHVHSSSARTGSPVNRAADTGGRPAGRPGSRPRTDSAPGPRRHGDVVAQPVDDVVAIRRLPAVPATAPQPAVVQQPAVAPEPPTAATGSRHVVVPRSVVRKEAAAVEAARRATRRRRGSRFHGILVYATGLVLVLSSVYGVAHAVGGGNVVTETASSLRTWCPGWGDGWGTAWRSDRDGERAGSGEVDTSAEVEPAEAPVAAAPVTEADAAVRQQDTTEVEAAAPEEGAADTQADAGRTGTATSQAASVAGARPSSATSTADVVAAGTWLSGAAGDGVTDGSFAAWRGTPLGIAGTWADNNEAMVELWQIDSGGEFGDWDQALDIAIGAIGEGESWAAAADGAYDERWRASLTNMRDMWGDRTAPLFIRFAHEMNGDWYDWSVDAGNHQDFIAAWRHFRALQQEIFPESKLVFAVNRESVGNDIDWRETFPGAEYVDVMGVDYYNQYPSVESAADWDASLTEVDEWGAPKGLQAHLDFARSVGLPLGIPEWSGKAENADSVAWMQGMHDFFASNAGGGAGQVLYDIQFNVDMHDDSYRVFPDTRMPASAEAYRAAF